MKATEDVLSAARQLLSVTCDCCEQLTPNWATWQSVKFLRPGRCILVAMASTLVAMASTLVASCH